MTHLIFSPTPTPGHHSENINCDIMTQLIFFYPIPARQAPRPDTGGHVIPGMRRAQGKYQLAHYVPVDIPPVGPGAVPSTSRCHRDRHERRRGIRTPQTPCPPARIPVPRRADLHASRTLSSPNPANTPGAGTQRKRMETNNQQHKGKQKEKQEKQSQQDTRHTQHNTDTNHHNTKDTEPNTTTASTPPPQNQNTPKETTGVLHLAARIPPKTAVFQ